MMRFHKFSAGPFWTDDYGSSDDAKGAQYLLAYSPLHNLKAGTCYPATLITTADRDDRVVPSHSFKFAAALQAPRAAKTDADPHRGCRQPWLPADGPDDRGGRGHVGIRARQHAARQLMETGGTSTTIAMRSHARLPVLRRLNCLLALLPLAAARAESRGEEAFRAAIGWTVEVRTSVSEPFVEDE